MKDIGLGIHISYLDISYIKILANISGIDKISAKLKYWYQNLGRICDSKCISKIIYLDNI